MKKPAARRGRNKDSPPKRAGKRTGTSPVWFEAESLNRDWLQRIAEIKARSVADRIRGVVKSFG